VGHLPARAAFKATKGGPVREVMLELVPVGGVGGRSVVPGIVLGSAAGAALVTGIALLGAGAAKRSTARTTSRSIQDAHRSCVDGAVNFDARCADLDRVGRTSDTLNRAGVGVLIGAGALGAGAAIYMLRPAPSSSKSSGTGATLMLSPTAAGVVVSGAF
jgi:hypothetical protein